MAKGSGKDRIAPTELRRAVCMWKLYTGQTQRDLAKELGIIPSHLCKILSGERPGHKYIAKIEQITGKYAS